MKTEMEKQEREHQESSAEVAVKHSTELKDLGRKSAASVSAQSRDSASTRINKSVCLALNHTQSFPTARS